MFDLKYIMYTGTLRGEGGPGGTQAEPGGPGTIYLYKLPLLDSSGKVPAGFITNRTLHVDNQNQGPKDPFRNLTSAYTRYNQSSAMTWLIPSGYPSFVPEIQSTTEITLDELQIFRQAQLAILNPSNPTQRINISVVMIKGDRSGHLHVGFNQSLWIGSGQIPNHLSLYHGADTTLQGELRVAGVNVMVEGVVNNVENLTVVDGGTAKTLYLTANFSKHMFNVKTASSK